MPIRKDRGHPFRGGIHQTDDIRVTQLSGEAAIEVPSTGLWGGAGGAGGVVLDGT